MNNKKKYGEVFTPFHLAREMVSKIPENILKNPNTKILEPSAGHGVFIIALYEKLKQYHTSSHILTNMLYAVELNPSNATILKTIMPNVYQQSFLDYNPPFKFDIIIGNPPYNANQIAKGKRGGGHNLWTGFVKNSINMYLKENGYLCFIHPSGWRKPPSDKSKYNGLYDLMTKQNQMLYLEIHNTTDGMKTFKCGTRYDWYILKNVPAYTTTTIKDEKGNIINIDLRDWLFLPNYNFDLVKPLLANDNNKCEIIYDRNNYGSDKKWVSKNETSIYKYPLIYSTSQKGIRYMYSSRNDNGHFGIKKVIFGETGIYNAIIDINGIYGMTQQSMAIPISSYKEGKKIKQFLESNEFKEILNACSWSNFRIDWRLFTYFKKDFYMNYQ